ncbi:MAG: GGDEF domain-containing protein [Treponema sp.]|jgi:diguanylate cyclase (GGDEF)-like protein|nr:GGDEF domain-containing protein [Treponema sp.]
MIEKILKSHAILSVISRLSLFSGLTEEEFEVASGVLQTVYVKKDDVLFNEGDPGEDMFIHFSGALNAYCTQSDGTQRLLFNVKLGDFFGEMSVISNVPRTATIIAAEDSVTILFKGSDFYRIIADYPIIGFKILRSISNVQNRWLDQASKSVSDLIRWGETARRRAITDEMTGLYNRRFLEDTIKERLSPPMSKRLMSLLMMDLDKIHGINDQYGTKAGDIVIITAANIIQSCLRPGDISARLSGDEFAIILPDTTRKDAVKIAERIREGIEKRQIEVPASPGSAEMTLIGTKTSIGIAMSPGHAKTMEELEENADTALRKAKELGRNRVEVFG